MDLRNEIKESNKIGSKNLRLKGEMKSYDAYRIPIKGLKYNRQNGRIATFISAYTEDKKISDIDEKTLEDFIYESTPEQNNKTQNNIERFGQIEPAVVLRDGTVIDGNRRFTCLRRLYREKSDEKFAYIVAVVLDDNKYSDKDIKKLELQIQNVEEKVDYKPIERYVDIYKSILEEPQEFSIKEYAHDSNKKESEIKEDVLLTNLMLEYLEFIGKPLKFHYAREQDLDGTINEMKSLQRSKSIKKSEKHLIKELCFSAFASGTPSKKIRDFIKATNDEEVFNGDKKEEGKDLSNDVYESFKNDGYINNTLKESVNTYAENLIEDFDLSKEKNKDEELVNKALKNIKKVDKENVLHMSSEYRESFDKKINLLKQEVDNLVNIDNA